MEATNYDTSVRLCAIECDVGGGVRIPELRVRHETHVLCCCTIYYIYPKWRHMRVRSTRPRNRMPHVNGAHVSVWSGLVLSLHGAARTITQLSPEIHVLVRTNWLLRLTLRGLVNRQCVLSIADELSHVEGPPG